MQPILQRTCLKSLYSINNYQTELETLSSRVDMLDHTGSAFDNPVTLTFDLLTLESTYAERLPCAIYLPSSVLLAQAVFLSKRGYPHKYTQTPLMTLLTHQLYRWCG